MQYHFRSRQRDSDCAMIIPRDVPLIMSSSLIIAQQQPNYNNPQIHLRARECNLKQNLLDEQIVFLHLFAHRVLLSFHFLFLLFLLRRSRCRLRSCVVILVSCAVALLFVHHEISNPIICHLTQLGFGSYTSFTMYSFLFGRALAVCQYCYYYFLHISTQNFCIKYTHNKCKQVQ